MSDFHKTVDYALMRLEQILGGTYGGPSLSRQDGKWVIYHWYDAPVCDDVLATGGTLPELVAAYDANPPVWRVRHPRTDREYVFPRDLQHYKMKVRRYQQTCCDGHGCCAAWEDGPCWQALARDYP